jgi:hypothetical protein
VLRLATSVVLIAAVGALWGLLFGYDIGVISGAQKFVLSPLLQGVVTSDVVGGAAVGAGSAPDWRAGSGAGGCFGGRRPVFRFESDEG